MRRQWLSNRFKPDRRTRGTSGQSLVETALSMMIAITVSFTVFELSIMMYSYCALNEAVREGVRYAIVHGTSSPSFTSCSSSTTNVQNTVASATWSSFQTINASSDVHVVYNPTASCAPNASVTVSITKTYVPLVGFLGINPTLTVKSQGRIIF